MDLLGGYGSDGSGSEEEDAQPAAPKKPKTSQPPAQGTSSSDGSTAKRKVVDFSKLPVRRPVVFDDKDGQGEADEAPLRKAAELESLRGGALSLLAALPPPKVTLGVDVDLNGAGSRIDLSEVKFDRSQKQVEVSKDIFHTTGSIMRGVSAPEVKESGEVPKDVMNHPMFRNDPTAGAGGDRPSMEEIHQMKSMKFMSIKAADVQDPDWYLHNQMAKSEPARNTGKVCLEVSAYEQKTWEKTTHANPSKNQKRKHQINWLAHEAMEKEAELLDRAASSRLTKNQTSMKYGW